MTTDFRGGAELEQPEKSQAAREQLELQQVQAIAAYDPESALAIEQAIVTLDQMERSIRHGFARKVFTLLGICLCLLMLTITPFLYSTVLRQWFATATGTIWIILAAGVVFVALMFFVTFLGPQQSRAVQLGGLFALPVFFGIFLGTILAHFDDVNLVWIAFGASLGLILVLFLFCSQRRFDISGWGPFVAVLVFVILILALFGALTGAGFQSGMGYVFVGLGVTVMSLYVVYDIQLVLGGKHRVQFKVDDYLQATVSLFTDFLFIFVLLLCALGGGARE